MVDIDYFRKRQKLIELRYNPYHDPSNGRFTSGGGGGGGMLVVPKGQKGKGFYVAPDTLDKGEKALSNGEYEKWQKESAVFKPSVTDAVSEKISSAYDIRVNGQTITIKDENDKTRGLVRGITKYDNMSFRDQVELNGKVGKALKAKREEGTYGVSKGAVRLNEMFKRDGKYYVLNNVAKGSQSQSERNLVLKTLESNGFIIVNYGQRT